MELQRNQDTSLVYWMQSLLTDSSFINVVSEYTAEELTVPSVVIETGNTTGKSFELGNPVVLLDRAYMITVYANNITQRNDYAYKIFNELTQARIPVYDYSDGVDDPERLGTLLFDEGRIKPVVVVPELVTEMYYRSIIFYTAIYDYNN